MAAQQSLRHAFLTLAGLDGRLLDPTEPLQVSGLRSGDSSTAVAEKLKGTATKGALALWCVGGNRIVTWGRSIKEATVRWSKISSRTFSRSIQQSVRLLQFWQMAALWRGAIPAGVATAPESLTNWGMFSRSMLQALPLLQSWQMEALWRGEIRTGVTTAPVSVTNWGMFSRSMLQSARLLQFWQMAALWRGAIPTGGEQQHSQRSVQIFVANCGIIFAANKLLHVTYWYQDVRHLTAWKWHCRRNEGWCCGCLECLLWTDVTSLYMQMPSNRQREDDPGLLFGVFSLLRTTPTSNKRDFLSCWIINSGAIQSCNL